MTTNRERAEKIVSDALYCPDCGGMNITDAMRERLEYGIEDALDAVRDEVLEEAEKADEGNDPDSFEGWNADEAWFSGRKQLRTAIRVMKKGKV